ncbi:hypothetical protein F5884DRAFT_87770 [Xylogone sp. PMI_703]|nr:hypothetical protein F5884DRAFT_87770 [Xylogone sp. PMI_703]
MYYSQPLDGYFPMADTRSIASPSYRNPFDVEAWGTISADMYQVIERYINQYYESSQLSKNPLRNTVMPAAMRFVGLFHSHLFNSLLNTAAMNGQSPGEMAFVHKGYVIRFVNESLSDEQRCCTDEVLTTVVALINEECIQGNIDKAEIHLQGLKRMVDLRGGIDCLGFEGDLKQIIVAHDYGFCVLTSSLPYRFTGPERISIVEDIIGESANLEDFRCFTFQEYFVGPEALDGIGLEVLYLLDYLSRLVCIYKAWNETDPAAYVEPVSASVSNRDALTARWSSIRSSLLDFPSADSPVSHPATNDYVYESLRLAIIILSRKGIPVMAPANKSASTAQLFEEDAKSLQKALEKTRLLEFWEPLPGAVLWCLAVGANACQKGMLKSWFSAHLLRTITTYALFRKKELDVSMRMILHGLRELQVPVS